MKLLITGSGGREHALALKLSESKKVEQIYCAPGNGATDLMEKCTNIQAENISQLVTFAVDNKIDLTIPGAEDLLVDGIVDQFQKEGLRIFGPQKDAALLEGSKSFAKDFMKKYGIKTAEYETFTNAEKALQYIHGATLPLVVKADGLAAGKGVLICQSQNEAQEAVKSIMIDNCFGDAGKSVVIEEFLQGYEASILSIFDGKSITPFISAKDHKKIGEGESGLNTGGMGAIAPNPYVTDNVFMDFQNNIMDPTVRGLKNEGLIFSGVIFFGLMITARGTYLLEYNLRLGDPETQAVLPLLNSDLLKIIESALEGKLSQDDLQWSGNCSCAVVQASGGYPLSYEKGLEIKGIEAGDLVYISGAELSDNKLITSGGRVLTVVGTACSAEDAKSNAYDLIHKIYFKDQYYRKDIGTID